MSDLRSRARDLFRVAIDAADPARALRAALAANPLPTPDAGGALIVVAVGKAARAMCAELLAHPGDAPVRARAGAILVVTNTENARDLPGARVMAAGHPVPDADGARAAAAVAALLSAAGPGDRVVALISGGGSALLPAPVAGLTLADKADVNRLLLAHGAPIAAINLIRQYLSRLKGGGMLRLAAPAPVTAYILSDVIGDDLRAIASGPTVAPLGTRAEAVATLHRLGLWGQIPASVRDHLSQPQPKVAPAPPARNILIGSNRKSLMAVRDAARDLDARIVSDALTGDVGAAAAAIVAAARAAPAGRLSCLIFGGETTVTLRGTGRGGRNQELALRVALAAEALPPGDWAFLSGGTDGRDGPTDAAGGLVDAGTQVRTRAAGRDPAALLADNDSHAALRAAGDLLITGPTGTNVADVQILLIRPEGSGA